MNNLIIKTDTKIINRDEITKYLQNLKEKIYVLEDDPDVADEVSMTLRHFGHQVVHFATIAAAGVSGDFELSGRPGRQSVDGQPHADINTKYKCVTN